VSKIAITELRENTYYALITLDVNGREVDIDARPSDALAIAVRLKSPIFASPALLKSMRQPGAPPEVETPRHAPSPTPGKRTTT
jgi:bifunctional DNase/RNase